MASQTAYWKVRTGRALPKPPRIDGVEGEDEPKRCVSSLTGAKISVATWNAKGTGRQLCSPEGGQLLRVWVKRHQPTILVIPEFALPAGEIRASRQYVQEFRQFAKAVGYVPCCAHHWTGHAQAGVAILVQTGIEVVNGRRGLSMDGTIQFKGRVLAIQLQGLWVLGVYMPHAPEQYEHMLKQAAT